MRAQTIYAAAFALRVVWGTFSLLRTWKRAPGWSRLRQQLVAVEVFSSASALLCAVALWAGKFAPWMLWPMGASILLAIPLPCFFEAVDRIGWLYWARNIFFIALGLFFFSVASGWIPPARLGL
jgi:hypothetical protein